MTQSSASVPSEGTHFAVHEVCQALGVSRSGFYAHQHKGQRRRQQEDRVLAAQIKRAFDQSYGTYGSPRLVRALRNQGMRTSKTRIRRLMQSQGLCPRQKRRVRACTTQHNSSLPVAPHLLRETPPARSPGERFYSDITYIPTQQGWLFLAATLDGYTRKCAGWSADDNMATPLVLGATQQAVARTGVPLEATTIHHSDRGRQYASEPFRDFLQAQGISQSMGRPGNCYANALMESFWASLKTECFDNFRHGIPATRQEAIQQLFAYSEVFYNRKRLHSALDYQAPIEFEANYYQQNLQQERSVT